MVSLGSPISGAGYRDALKRDGRQPRKVYGSQRKVPTNPV